MMSNERIQRLRILVENHVLTRDEYRRLVRSRDSLASRGTSFVGCLLSVLGMVLSICGVAYAIQDMVSSRASHQQYQEAVTKSRGSEAKEIIRNEPYVFDSSGVPVGTNTGYIAYEITDIEKKMALKLKGIDTPLKDIRLEGMKVSRILADPEFKPIQFRVVLRENSYADIMFFPLSSQWLYVKNLNEVTIPAKEILAFRHETQNSQNVCRKNGGHLGTDLEETFFELFCDEADSTRFRLLDVLGVLPYFIFNRYHPLQSILTWMIICWFVLGIRVVIGKIVSKLKGGNNVSTSMEVSK